MTDFPEDIYSTRILEVSSAMPTLERLENPQGSGTAHSRLCGSRVSVDLNLDETGKISSYGHDIEACLLGQTSASVMAQNAIGLNRAEVVAARKAMVDMLKHDGPAPEGIWSDLEVLYPVKDYKPRHESMLLVFDATLRAMDQIEQHQAGKIVGKHQHAIS